MNFVPSLDCGSGVNAGTISQDKVNVTVGNSYCGFGGNLQDKQDLIFQLEKELGYTVRKLETARTRQVQQMDTMKNEITFLRMERDRLKINLEKNEEEMKIVRKQIEIQRINMESEKETWQLEKRELMQNLAQAATRLDDVATAEKTYKNQLEEVKRKLQSVESENVELICMDKSKTAKYEQLESRSVIQAEQNFQLREKLKDLTRKLDELTKSKRNDIDESKQLHSILEQTKEENKAIEEDKRLKEKTLEEIKSENQKLHSILKATQESLQNTIDLANTREKQVQTLQQELSAEQDKSKSLEETHHRELLRLETHVKELYVRCEKAETTRANDMKVYQNQINLQRENTLKISKQLAELELSNRRNADNDKVSTIANHNIAPESNPNSTTVKSRIKDSVGIEDPLSTSVDVCTPLKTTLQINNDIDVNSPATVMIREFLKMQSKGEKLDAAKILEISENHARALAKRKIHIDDHQSDSGSISEKTDAESNLIQTNIRIPTETMETDDRSHIENIDVNTSREKRVEELINEAIDIPNVAIAQLKSNIIPSKKLTAKYRRQATPSKENKQKSLYIAKNTKLNGTLFKPTMGIGSGPVQAKLQNKVMKRSSKVKSKRTAGATKRKVHTSVVFKTTASSRANANVISKRPPSLTWKI